MGITSFDYSQLSVHRQLLNPFDDQLDHYILPNYASAVLSPTPDNRQSWHLFDIHERHVASMIVKKLNLRCLLYEGCVVKENILIWSM